MFFPELAQHFRRVSEQRHKPVPIALGITDKHSHPLCIEIAHLQLQSFPKAQANAVQSKKEHPVAEVPASR
nr:hypothetical protein [Nitrosomonas mobilis]